MHQALFSLLQTSCRHLSGHQPPNIPEPLANNFTLETLYRELVFSESLFSQKEASDSYSDVKQGSRDVLTALLVFTGVWDVVKCRRHVLLACKEFSLTP